MSEEEYSKSPEFLLAEISVPNKFLAVVYRPLYCGYMSDFFNIFTDLSSSYRHTSIFGDCNANLISKSYDSDQILNFVFVSALYSVPYISTYHTATSDALLDLCIVDDQNKLIDFKEMLIFSHRMILWTSLIICMLLGEIL